MDQRFRKVALVLKNWNRCISSKKEKRLNSFSIYILLLAFMLEHKYMINLQAEAPQTAPLQVKVHTDRATTTKITTYVDFLTDINTIDKVMEEKLIKNELRYQKRTAADILVHFFKFYLFQFTSNYHVACVGRESAGYFYNTQQLDSLFHPHFVEKRRN